MANNKNKIFKKKQKEREEQQKKSEFKQEGNAAEFTRPTSGVPETLQSCRSHSFPISNTNVDTFFY